MTVVTPAEPATRFAVPALTFNTPSVPLDVKLPVLVIVVVPPTIPAELIVVVPPERLAEPVMFPELVKVPADWVRFVAVPPVKFAVPPLTVRAWSDAFEVNVPAETVVVPPTVAEDVAVVVPLVTANVLCSAPPVMLSVPLLVTAPLTMPPVTAVVPVPLTPRVDRLPVVVRLPVPLVVVAPTTTPPALMVAVPPDTPRVPVMLPTLVSVPLVCNTFVAVPPVRVAVPPLTLRACSDAFEVNEPSVTVVAPETMAGDVADVVPFVTPSVL